MKVVMFNIDLRLNPQDKHTVIVKSFFPYSDENVEKARALSVDGNVEITELPNNESEPTQLDIIEAQVTYTAMMTDTLLEV